MIPPPGNEASLFVDAPGGEPLQLRHGSSLALMSSVCEFLASPNHEDNFSYIDPTADHHKWGRKGMDLYYAAVFSPSGSILSALRAATQGLGDSGKKRPCRLLIDYVYTESSARGKGIANLLVNFVIDTATNFGAHCYVLSLEESAVYWMEKHGFFLCESAALNERLNVFPDTHLMWRGVDQSADQQDLAHLSSGAASMPSTPPDKFTTAFHRLVMADSTPQMTQCLSSLAVLIKNASTDPEGSKRTRFKMDNPVVKERVFIAGGDDAMSILVSCGFELGVDEDENTIMQFIDTGALWIPAAIEQLEKEAARKRK